MVLSTSVSEKIRVKIKPDKTLLGLKPLIGVKIDPEYSNGHKECFTDLGKHNLVIVVQF